MELFRSWSSQRLVAVSVKKSDSSTNMLLIKKYCPKPRSGSARSYHGHKQEETSALTLYSRITPGGGPTRRMVEVL